MRQDKIYTRQRVGVTRQSLAQKQGRTKEKSREVRQDRGEQSETV